MDVANLAQLYRDAVTVRNEAMRESMRTSIAQAAAVASALGDAKGRELSKKDKSRGDDVRQVQLALAARGHDVRVDGAYDGDTEAAVKAFQQSAGLDTSGVVDERTWTVLRSAPGAAALAAQAEANVTAVEAAVAATLRDAPDDVGRAEAIALEAATAEALAAEALAAEPLAAEPLAAEPVAAEPLAAEPIAAEPLAAEPLAAEPIAAEPLAAEPVAAEPLAAEPLAAEPLAGEPVTAEFAGTDPLTVALRAFVTEHGTNE